MGCGGGTINGDTLVRCAQHQVEELTPDNSTSGTGESEGLRGCQGTLHLWSYRGRDIKDTKLTGRWRGEDRALRSRTVYNVVADGSCCWVLYAKTRLRASRGTINWRAGQSGYPRRNGRPFRPKSAEIL